MIRYTAFELLPCDEIFQDDGSAQYDEILQIYRILLGKGSSRVDRCCERKKEFQSRVKMQTIVIFR